MVGLRGICKTSPCLGKDRCGLVSTFDNALALITGGRSGQYASVKLRE